MLSIYCNVLLVSLFYSIVNYNEQNINFAPNILPVVAVIPPSPCCPDRDSLVDLRWTTASVGATSAKDRGKRSATCVSNKRELTDGQPLICSPLSETQESQQQSQDSQSQSRTGIRVFIRTPNNATKFELGSTLTIECRFNASTNLKDLKFSLRWLRSVVGSDGANQSITTTDTGDSSSTIIAAITRVWTVQRNGGLDLELNDFQSSDVGQYFCQALSPDLSATFSEAQVELGQLPSSQHHHQAEGGNENQLGEFSGPGAGATVASLANDSVPDNSNNLNQYSQHHLSKLLPSLKVLPGFSELALGESIMLACITSSDLDPDPEPDQLEWSFEPLSAGRWQLLLRAPIAASQLPNNVSVVGNTLTIWSLSEEHLGLYKCTLKLGEFNLSAQATGEVALRPQEDSAPLVFVSPELIRMSPNGSASIQCEATGYPAPEITWYRVETLDQVSSDGEPVKKRLHPSESSSLPEGTSPSAPIETKSTLSSPALDPKWLELNGIEIERIAYRDALAYCHSKRDQCRSSVGDISSAQVAPSGGGHARTSVTGLSLIHLSQARAQHQGQYVCRASNKHGSNQASALVDVEYKEPPVVRIAEELREQTIELAPIPNESNPINVTFKCSIDSGRPQPKLRWLRTTHSPGNFAIKSASETNNNNLDLYDLTKVSSATSNVSTWFEDQGRSLLLSISTISLDDEGDYICLGENEWARHTAVARLNIHRPASVRIQQQSPLVARINDSFHVDCLATGHPAPLDIEWSRSDQRGAYFSLISRPSNSLQGSQVRAVLKFDRVSHEDSGEYTCLALDPLNSANTLRDTIMVLVEEEISSNLGATSGEFRVRLSNLSGQLPKLMVRPTKVNAPLGSNVTLDCLTVSGLQPTIVEWVGPPMMSPGANDAAAADQQAANKSIQFVPRASGTNSRAAAEHLLQFGSKLKIFNVTKAHEGVYQCRGKNKVGVENAPALLKVIEQATDEEAKIELASLESRLAAKHQSETGGQLATKTKVAKVGSNIELKCQVNGVEQPATSWSREGLELPSSGVQIGHNLWIQNVSARDNGLYICSARSKKPNQVIQAKINLLVVQHGLQFEHARSMRVPPELLIAKVVASKQQVSVGDSITLECMVSQVVAPGGLQTGTSSGQSHVPGADQSGQRLRPGDLDEIERNVVWTNSHSGQSLFQDNVYLQNNLLIIYELKPENSATYRCNYNELSQKTDYKLQVLEPSSVASATNESGRQQELTSQQLLMGANGRRAELKQVSLGGQLTLECPAQVTSANSGLINAKNTSHYWTRGGEQQRVVQVGGVLTFDSIRTSDADLYHCYSRDQFGNDQLPAVANLTHLVQVLVPVAKFPQRPVSFITLPTISGADHQLEIEVKLLPERDHGLILFNGPPGAVQQQNQHQGANGNQNSNNKSAQQRDYISLGLNRGHLEFRFELGDGTTILRSAQSLALNQWHRVLIERNRRGAVMWLDKQPVPVSNSSAGKFFNLNLDSVLYVGGHQFFLNKSLQTGEGGLITRPNSSTGRFYGYSRGFQGCIGQLRISRQEINLMSRNRSVSIGVYECDKPECNGKLECNAPSQGICQVERTVAGQHTITSGADLWPPASWLNALHMPQTANLHSQQQIQPVASDLRCLCLPGFMGESCNRTYMEPTLKQKVSSPQQQQANYNGRGKATFESASGAASSTSLQPQPPGGATGTAVTTTTTNGSRTAVNPPAASACELLGTQSCAANGTLECQSLTSISFKCHCKLGFMGDTCSQAAQFNSETRVWFNQQAYLQFRLNKPEEAQAYLATARPREGANSTTFTNFTRLATSMAEHQVISFKLRTKSSYGLILYTGQGSLFESQNGGAQQQSALAATPGGSQTSKSMVANMLARLSNIVFDYLAIALVDGHIELSYELGSGVAIIRSSERVNDGQEHEIRVERTGKLARLIIDQLHRHEGSSPGKLSMLNSEPDIYLGGLPHLAELTNNMYMSGFVGCVSELEINSLGPLNLIRSDHLSQLRSARNLAPCDTPPPSVAGADGTLPGETTSSVSPGTGNGGLLSAARQQKQQQQQQHKPYQAPASSESDDSDEMR